MKRLVGFGLIILIIILTAVLVPQPVLASNLQQGGTWSAAIAYFNPTASSGELTVSYYPEGGSGFTPTQLNVNSHYSGTVLVGATPGSEGSAVLSSNFQMPAVYKIAGTSGNPYGVIMLEFFTGDQVGLGDFYLPVVRKESNGLTSRIGIQNIESLPVDVELTFVDASGAVALITTIQDIPQQSSEVFKTTDAEYAGLLSGFEGSLVINATLDGTAAAAKVVAASADVDATDTVVHSYQGVMAGSTSVFIPAVFCNYGRTERSTTLHVQNTSEDILTQDSISIAYYDSAGVNVANHSTPAAEIQAGQRIAVNVCAAGTAVEGKALSATVTHASAGLAVVVETTNNQGLSATSISAAPYCASGACTLALPYVEWSSSAWDFQTSIYIMNTGGSPTNITATYYRRDGTSEQQTFTGVPSNTMVETNPTQVADLMNMTYRDFKGAVLLESTNPVMALVLVTKNFQNGDGSLLTRGDSYMGILYTPEQP